MVRWMMPLFSVEVQGVTSAARTQHTVARAWLDGIAPMA
jgi:hypothetical protein